MAVCGACGTENRDKARFCLGCATSLAAAAPAPPPDKVKTPGPRQTCPSCQSNNPLAATACTSCGASLVPDLAAPPSGAGSATGRGFGQGRSLMTGFVLVAVFAGAWWFQSQRQSPSVAPRAVLAPSPVEAASPPPVASNLRQVSSDLAVAAASLSADPKTRVVSPRTAGSDDPKTSAQRNRTAAERQSPGRAVAARPVEPPVASPRVAQAPAAVAADSVARPPAAPPSAMAVDQTCAGSSNFIARDICRVKACSDAANTSDPVCIRFRQMEEANRREPSN